MNRRRKRGAVHSAGPIYSQRQSDSGRFVPPGVEFFSPAGQRPLERPRMQTSAERRSDLLDQLAPRRDGRFLATGLGVVQNSLRTLAGSLGSSLAGQQAPQPLGLESPGKQIEVLPADAEGPSGDGHASSPW